MRKRKQINNKWLVEKLFRVHHFLNENEKGNRAKARELVWDLLCEVNNQKNHDKHLLVEAFRK